MEKRPGETVSHDVDTLFRLGVVAAMTDEQLLERFAADAEADRELLLKQLCGGMDRWSWAFAAGGCAIIMPPRTRFRPRFWFWQ